MDESTVSESKPYRSILVNLGVALSVLVLDSYIYVWSYAVGQVVGGYIWGGLIFLLIRLMVRDVKNYDKYRKRDLYLSTVNWVQVIAFAGGLIQRAQQ